jgi:hypothetical protein
MNDYSTIAIAVVYNCDLHTHRFTHTHTHTHTHILLAFVFVTAPLSNSTENRILYKLTVAQMVKKTLS